MTQASYAGYNPRHLGRWRSPATELATNSGPDAVSPELVQAMVPQQMLHEDEVVLLLTKPSLFFIIFDSALFVAVALIVGSIGAQLAVGSEHVSPRLVATASGIACIARLVWSLLVWSSHVYMLTNHRVVTVKGVLNVHVFQAPLRKIQKTELYRPLLQRLVGTGTIGFATAAASGIESTWVMLARPIETHEKVVAAINKMSSR
jgi:uncharacterized membrane protein YdbT with pleckstrin-like domain